MSGSSARARRAPARGGFGHSRAPVLTASGAPCQPHTAPMQHPGGHPTRAGPAAGSGWGRMGQPAGSRAPPCCMGRTSEMLCFQLAPAAAAEGAGIREPAHSCRTAGRPRTQTWVCSFPRGLRRTAPTPLPSLPVLWLGLAGSSRGADAGGGIPWVAFAGAGWAGVCVWGVYLIFWSEGSPILLSPFSPRRLMGQEWVRASKGNGAEWGLWPWGTWHGKMVRQALPHPPAPSSPQLPSMPPGLLRPITPRGSIPPHN